jgi:hypothetical protein
MHDEGCGQNAEATGLSVFKLQLQIKESIIIYQSILNRRRFAFGRKLILTTYIQQYRDTGMNTSTMYVDVFPPRHSARPFHHICSSIACLLPPHSPTVSTKLLLPYHRQSEWPLSPFPPFPRPSSLLLSCLLYSCLLRPPLLPLHSIAYYCILAPV